MVIDKPLFVGIDASNLRRGGGVTHLKEFLRNATPHAVGIEKIIVWADATTLAQLDDRSWLVKVCPAMIQIGGVFRYAWQAAFLGRATRAAKCDVLFVPGGSYLTTFRPIVVMCRNLLMFETKEMNRYGLSMFYLKLRLLKWLQIRSFRRADGLVFLTDYARSKVVPHLGSSKQLCETISHGVGEQFFHSALKGRGGDTFKLVYVSIVDLYKHQWNVVQAVSILRSRGIDIQLELIGPAEPRALARLEDEMSRVDAEGKWVKYLGAVNFSEIQNHYYEADAAVFASSCENMPNILLEMMASGLPVACSNRGPMPEILGKGGWYFDPENVEEIAVAISKMIQFPKRLAGVGRMNASRASRYTWDACAVKTLDLLLKVAHRSRKSDEFLRQ